ncbi:MAG: hypothetical protein HY000_19195 [Planctomycetes bacterium]|nr:hypothetical protein [Planctomycetota bacterium]
MFRQVVWSAVACVAVTGLVWATDPSPPKPGQSVPSKLDRCYGTALQWESSVEAAVKKARQTDKLLLVLAVAGHFEDPFFT